MEELSQQVRDVLDVSEAAFEDRVRIESEDLKLWVNDGTFDNAQALVGLEFELYGVSERDQSLSRLARRVLTLIGFEAELGLHNAEMQTTPQPLSAPGLAAQRRELQARFDAAQERLRTEGLHLVSDGMWTIPPTGETATDYLIDSVNMDGIYLGTNVSASPRYHGIANAEYPSGMRIDTPHVSLEGGRPEMLTTSIQPHYQVPRALDLPEYFTYALRIAGPLVALGANSPFFPPDLYDEDASPDAILRDCWREHRIGVFETALNPVDSDREKVRFPRDIQSVEEAIDRIATDEIVLPMQFPEGTDFNDAFRHFLHQSGTYWRWIRPVFDGETKTEAHARIEFRPLSAQPTLWDTVALQAVYGGLLTSLHQTDHPLRELDWERAKQNFYAAVKHGFDADLLWRSANGGEVTDIDRIFDELFEYARDGLRIHGLTEDQINSYLDPLEERVSRHLSPADWKIREVRRRLEQGEPLTEAIWGMQVDYIDNQGATFIDGTFVDWLSKTESD